MDAKAIFTTVAVMVFANGAVLATVYRDLPATLRPAAARWQAGTVLVAAGCAIFAFGSFLPMPIMVALANFVLTTGLTIYHRALRNFYGRPAETWDMALPFVATASVYWWSAIEPSFIIRLGVISLMWLWLMGRSLHLLHAMRHVDTSRSRSMRTASRRTYSASSMSPSSRRSCSSISSCLTALSSTSSSSTTRCTFPSDQRIPATGPAMGKKRSLVRRDMAAGFGRQEAGSGNYAPMTSYPPLTLPPSPASA